MKKYAIILNGQIATTYEAETKQSFGGPWGSEDALHLEVPNNISLSRLVWDGEEFSERAKTQEELDSELRAEIAANKEKGQKIISEVLFLNDKREASDEVKLSFIGNSSIKQVQDLLNIGRLSLARTVISAIEVDGLIFTNELKQAVLDYMDSL